MKRTKELKHNPFVKNMIQVWYDVYAHRVEIPVLSQFTPIWGNTDFTPNLSKITHLFNNHINLKIWDESMTSKQNTFWNTDTVRNYIFKMLKSLSLPTLTSIEDLTTNEYKWEDLLKISSTTTNTHFKLLQYKWIMRLYITPTQLNKFNPNNSDTRYKCVVRVH